jgi:hypothetical protein
MTRLSPVSLAVLAAFAAASDGEYIDGEWYQDDAGQVAAALEAAVDWVLPVTRTPWGSTMIPMLTTQESRDRLLSIATELRGING